MAGIGWFLILYAVFTGHKRRGFLTSWDLKLGHCLTVKAPGSGGFTSEPVNYFHRSLAPVCRGGQIPPFSGEFNSCAGSRAAISKGRDSGTLDISPHWLPGGGGGHSPEITGDCQGVLAPVCRGLKFDRIFFPVSKTMRICIVWGVALAETQPLAGSLDGELVVKLVAYATKLTTSNAKPVPRQLLVRFSSK